MKIFEENNVKGSTIVLSIFAVIAICVTVFIFQDEKIDLKNLSMLTPKHGKTASQFVQCRLYSNLGAKDYLMLEMSIPYRDKNQQEDLKGKLEGIKSDILTNMNQQELAKWIQERNYDAIKAELLKVINSHTNKPVEHIYFDSLIYQ
jgi:flagellar basal body-associated protein FliL